MKKKHNDKTESNETLQVPAIHTPRITTPSDLRGVLVLTIEGLLEGRVDVHRANAIARLTEQIHSSIDKEWDMRVYAANNFGLKAGEVVKLISGEDDNGLSEVH